MGGLTFLTEHIFEATSLIFSNEKTYFETDKALFQQIMFASEEPYFRNRIITCSERVFIEQGT